MEYTKPIMTPLNQLNTSYGIVTASQVHVEFCAETYIYLAIAFVISCAVAIAVPYYIV